MVTKLKNVRGVSQTGIKNLVVFSYLNKIAIFDLEKREVIKEIIIRNCNFLDHVTFGKFIGIYASIPCLIDLEKMEIVKKLNAYDIAKKLLKKQKYQLSNYYMETNGCKIVDILPEKFLYLARYKISPFSNLNETEMHTAICSFSILTGELLSFEEYKDEYSYFHKCYEREEPKYSFLEYDDDVIDKVVSSIKIKKEKNFSVLLYNKKYNVLFFRNGDHCYSYYIDSCNETNDEVVIPENDLFNKPGFDEQDYIRMHGLTCEVLNYFSDEELLDGGYFWALESIERKEKELNIPFYSLFKENKITNEELILFSVGLFETFLQDDGLEEYFASEANEGVAYLIKALKLIGAEDTAKSIKKGIKILACNDSEDKTEKFIKLEEELDEDYIGKAIQYIKNSKLKD